MSALVLIAERDPFNLRLLEELCDEAGIDVVTAGDGAATLTVIARRRPALIILDAALRTDDGASVLEVLHADPALDRIPVLLTLADDDEEARRKGAELGAADFLTRPYRVLELERRVRSLLRLSEAERAAERWPASLLAPEETTDPLTHAGSATQLRITLDYEATRAVRYDHALTCLVLRVTNLSEIVASGGEEAERGLLVQLATSLRGIIRAIDHLFRSDDDELTMLLPETVDAGPVVSRLTREAAEGTLTGLAIEPAARLALGRALIRPGGAITDGEALLRAARAGLAPLNSERGLAGTISQEAPTSRMMDGCEALLSSSRARSARAGAFSTARRSTATAPARMPGTARTRGASTRRRTPTRATSTRTAESMGGKGPMPDQSTAGRWTPDRPTADRPTPDRPTADRPTADRPTAGRPTADHPTRAVPRRTPSASAETSRRACPTGR